MTVQWISSSGEVAYPDALREMDVRVADIRAGSADEAVWLLEHPPLYTAGTSAKEQDLLRADFPVFKAGRGGEHTYHGPGQRVAYAMLDLKARQAVPDIKKYVWQLEEWIIRSLAHFDVVGERREGRVGIWVDLHMHGREKGQEISKGREAKIAAIGVRIRRWVAFHGIAINVAPNLNHFDGIVPCGISQYGVTSLQDLGIEADMKALDKALKVEFANVFG